MLLDNKETVCATVASSTYHLGLRTEKEKKEVRSRDKQRAEVSGLWLVKEKALPVIAIVKQLSFYDTAPSSKEVHYKIQIFARTKLS